jgi:predicted GNAT family N-acyltransferase
MAIRTESINTEDELAEAFSIRRQVFIIDQNVPEEIEMDEFDKVAQHALAYWNEIPVGTARWRHTDKGAKLERFAVLKDYRKIGIGKALVEFILKQLESVEMVYLSAQEPVIQFYEKFSFECIGERFFEANIPHRQMILRRQI